MRTVLPGLSPPLSLFPLLSWTFEYPLCTWDGTRCHVPLAVCRGSRGSRHLRLCLDPKQFAANSLLSDWIAAAWGVCDTRACRPASKLTCEVVSGSSTCWLSEGGLVSALSQVWFGDIREFLGGDFGEMCLCLHLHMGVETDSLSL